MDNLNWIIYFNIYPIHIVQDTVAWKIAQIYTIRFWILKFSLKNPSFKQNQIKAENQRQLETKIRIQISRILDRIPRFHEVNRISEGGEEAWRTEESTQLECGPRRCRQRTRASAEMHERRHGSERSWNGAGNERLRGKWMPAGVCWCKCGDCTCWLVESVSQSVSRLGTGRDARSRGFFLLLRPHVYTHAHNTIEWPARLDTHRFTSVSPASGARHSIPACCSAQFFRLDFPSRLRNLPVYQQGTPSVSVLRRISGPVEITIEGHVSASTR